MPVWARVAILVLIVLLFVLMGVLWPRTFCPEDQVWVMSDGKWVCVRAEGS